MYLFCALFCLVLISFDNIIQFYFPGGSYLSLICIIFCLFWLRIFSRLSCVSRPVHIDIHMLRNEGDVMFVICWVSLDLCMSCVQYLVQVLFILWRMRVMPYSCINSSFEHSYAFLFSSYHLDILACCFIFFFFRSRYKSLRTLIVKDLRLDVKLALAKSRWTQISKSCNST